MANSRCAQLRALQLKWLKEIKMSFRQALFTILPYVALTTLLVGSIYRYRMLGFKVTSLSSQFLESRKLFWGTQPFHWGILIVFLGHLAAFAIPQTVLAWNGQPWRLLALEWTMFAFALSAMFGLAALIVRRLSDARLRKVTSRMDVILYILLTFQFMTGLMIAYFDRWGTSWFSSSVTPYLRSIFIMNPKVDAILVLPDVVQLHILSAFVIFGLIPFTRLIHFTVFPLNYTWRPYQQVIWNWVGKNRRNTRDLRVGVKPKNN